MTTIHLKSCYGFKEAGKWGKKGKEIFFCLDMYEKGKYEKDKNVIYAFVVSNDVQYIGSTKKTLEQRMKQYKTGSGQATNNRIKRKICGDIKNKKMVKIFVLKPKAVRFRNVKIQLLRDLEDALINILKKQNLKCWNNLKKKKTSVSDYLTNERVQK